jgi:uncharacterized protein (TIGR00299 family) protein
MRALHFDCFSGISGDMTLAALIDAGANVDTIRAGIDSLGLPIRMEIEKVRKGGFAATHVRFEVPAENTHRFLPDIEAILGRGSLTAPQRDLALRIFRRLAEAESTAHGMPLERVHFHEVGALDSIADIVGSAIALDLLHAERITSRSVPTGHGAVECEHGRMPIPTPGTAVLLKGVPLAACDIQAELTTPTGAAILTTIVQEWVEQPLMAIEAIGHGAGTRNFPEQPNLLRVFVGSVAAPLERDQVWVLESNLDDVPAETIGYCYELLLAAGALDVFTIPIFMKKNRPGVLLSVLAPESALAGLEEILFRETATLGIRRHAVDRHKLKREQVNVNTRWGPIRGKLALLPGREPLFSPEFDDCARIAREQQIPLRDVQDAAERAFHESRSV